MSTTGPENSFIGSVHKHLSGDVYCMKNHNQYNGGIADCWYSMRHGRDMWVEYKFIDVPKRPDTVIDLVSRKGKADSVISSLQKQWLHDRHNEGRTVGVIVGSKDGGVWLPGIDWDMAYTAEFFVKKLQSRKQLAHWIEEYLTR